VSKKKEGPKKGSDVEEEDPKHLNRDPRTKVLIKQRKARKRRHEEKQQSAQSEKREEREQESGPPESEPVVEPGNKKLRTRFLKLPLKGKIELNPRDSPDSDKYVRNKSKPRQRLSSSSQSGSDVDCRRKAERTPSQSCSDNVSESQFGETSGQSGSDDENSDDSLTDRGSTYLRGEAGKDEMSVNLTRLVEVPA
jgi:hypothetical protein